MAKTKRQPVFYTVPASKLTPGASTDDGQYIISVYRQDDYIFYTVYTPRPDNPDADDRNLAMSETRIASFDNLVQLAIFEDTEVDLTAHAVN